MRRVWVSLGQPRSSSTGGGLRILDPSLTVETASWTYAFPPLVFSGLACAAPAASDGQPGLGRKLLQSSPTWRPASRCRFCPADAGPCPGSQAPPGVRSRLVLSLRADLFLGPTYACQKLRVSLCGQGGWPAADRSLWGADGEATAEQMNCPLGPHGWGQSLGGLLF